MSHNAEAMMQKGRTSINFDDAWRQREARAFGAKRSFAPVKKVLETALRRNGLKADISKYMFVLHWPEIVGEEIAKRTKPECIRGKSLVVRVTNSVWSQELTFQKDIILKRLNKFLGNRDEVKDIQFFIGPLKP